MQGADRIALSFRVRGRRGLGRLPCTVRWMERPPLENLTEAERFRLVRRRVLQVLWLIAVALFALHYVVMFFRFVLDRPTLYGFSVFLNVDEEESLATFLQMVNLLGASVLLFMVGRRTRRLGAPHAMGWLSLSAIFLYLAIDESTLLHEHLILPLQRALDAGGIFFFTWVVVAIPLLVFFLVLYIPFLRDLDPETRKGFIVAGLVYVAGALGMEMAGGVWVEGRSFIDPIYLTVFVPLEEGLETAGQLLFLSVLLRYVARHQPLALLWIDDQPRSLRGV
jgi:hypothetical protein